MSDLLAILNMGASSLAAQSAAMATASHNVQNASTPGYARQRVTLEAVLPAEQVGGAFIGRGARLATVTQARDRFLEAQIPGLLGSSARAATTARTLQAVAALDPDQAGGVGDALSQLYASLRALTQAPADPSLRGAVVAQARTLALAFQRTRAGLEGARSGTDAQLLGHLQEANDLAAQVAGLNGAIRAARASGGGEPNDLLDARQKAVDRLAELTGASPVATSEGDLSLFLPGGAALVSSLHAGTLAAAADPANGGHLALSLSFGGSTQAFSGMGGQLGGLLDARDGALRTAVTSLDTLAWDLAGALNAAHRAGVGLDGSTGLDLLTVGTTLDGAAARLDVSALLAADPGRLAAASAGGSLPGDNTNALALVATERQALSGGLDAFGSLASLTSAFGATTRSAEAMATHEQALADDLQARRESVSGVSIDEELIEMQKAQRGYEAISRVIQASSAMFETLLQLK